MEESVRYSRSRTYSIVNTAFSASRCTKARILESVICAERGRDGSCTQRLCALRAGTRIVGSWMGGFGCCLLLLLRLYL